MCGVKSVCNGGDWDNNGRTRGLPFMEGDKWWMDGTTNRNAIIQDVQRGEMETEIFSQRTGKDLDRGEAVGKPPSSSYDVMRGRPQWRPKRLGKNSARLNDRRPRNAESHSKSPRSCVAPTFCSNFQPNLPLPPHGSPLSRSRKASPPRPSLSQRTLIARGRFCLRYAPRIWSNCSWLDPFFWGY
ncbi:uncharacterized protein BJX67DRAFT_36631 [Aspergillus lucknowensis]|uniref:Uncharacterized protein n=1 Tax=Aspergillus lucknowensis TaxID=176173 RepID=A0ABR4LW39_9EURO